MALILSRCGDKVKITEDMVMAAASSLEWRRGNDAPSWTNVETRSRLQRM